MSSTATSSTIETNPVRRTQAGQVRGTSAGGVCRFLAIPYAAPPVGENRFREPQPVLPWDGERDASRPGPCAPHKIATLKWLDVVSLVGDGGERGDDYLTLNLWAPEAAGPGAKRPVMVFIHGGGFVIGSKDAPVHNGTGFARSGLVCVAINYRLGIEGFLPIPGAPTNLGLRDMLCALRWVQDNVEAFGGDPANVTVFGESAGAMAIADLVTSPLATGLFRRAIVQSGHGSMVRPIPIARRLVDKLARNLKVSPDVDGFRRTGFEEGWRAMERVSKPLARLDLRDTAGHEPVFGISRFVPVYGDDVLPLHPLAALAAGAGRDIELLIGTNAAEMNLYFVPSRIRSRIPGFLARWLLGKSNPNARAALKAYGLGARGKKPGEAMTEAMTDLVFRWPARQYASLHQGRTHLYEFDWHSPACDGELGACHAMEMPFVFDTLATATGEQGLAGTAPPQALADRIHRLWVGFASDGSLPWDPFSDTHRRVHRLAAGETIEEPVMPAAAFLP